MGAKTFCAVLVVIVPLLNVSCASMERSKSRSGYVSRHLLSTLHEGMSRDHCKLILGHPESVSVGDRLNLPLGRRARSFKSIETWNYEMILDPPRQRTRTVTPRVDMPPQELPSGGIRTVKLLFLDDMLAGINVENATAGSPDAIRLR